MVSVLNEDDENQQGPGQGTPGTQGGPSTQGPVAPVGGGAVRLSPSSGVGSSVGGGGTAGSGSAQGAVSGGANAGGQFATLNDYTSVNAPAAQTLANQVTAPIQNQYSNLESGNTSTEAGINQAITSGYTPYQDLSSQVAPQNVVSFANNPTNVSNFQGQANDVYKGPSSIEGNSAYQTQLGNVNNAITSGNNLTQSTEGQNQLLKNVETAVPNNPGVTALNEAILTQNPNYEAQVSNAYQPFQNLVGELQSYAPTGNAAIATGKQQAGQASTEANNAINQAVTGLNTNVNQALASAQGTATAQNNQVSADLAAGKPTAADLANLGITSDQWNSLSAADKAAATPQLITSANGQFGANTGTANISNANYLTQGNPTTAITAANVATPEQYAQSNAYNTLIGGINASTPPPVLNQITAGQAGTAPTNLNTFNYQNALTTAQQTGQQEVAAAQAYVAALQGGADEAHAQAAAANAQKNEKTGIAANLANASAAPIATSAVVGQGIVGAAESIPQNYSTPTRAGTSIGEDIATGGLATPAKAVMAGVNSVVNAVKSGTWICTEMKRSGVMTQREIITLRKHLYKAFYKTPLPFLKYLILGKPLVILANFVGIDWHLWKFAFYTSPMSIEDPIKAVEAYERAFWILAHTVYYKIIHKEICHGY
jgi:trimeric autotransporter adhesin